MQTEAGSPWPRPAVSRTERYSTAEGPTATAVLRAEAAPHRELWCLQSLSQTSRDYQNDRRVRPSRPHALPAIAGRGGLRPGVLAPQAAHAPSSWRLGSASPGRLCSRVESAPARSLGGSPPPPPLPLTPRGGSGPGGTMFTSTGSSGLCEYRLLYPWGSLRSVLGTSRTRLGGPGDSALQKARGPLASRVRALAVLEGGSGCRPHRSPEGREGSTSSRFPAPPEAPVRSSSCPAAGGLGSWGPAGCSAALVARAHARP